MAVEKEIILSLIGTKFPDADIELIDTVGDKDHYDLIVKSSKFIGQSRVLQHKMVLDALGNIVGTTLHAISIKTLVK